MYGLEPRKRLNSSVLKYNLLINHNWLTLALFSHVQAAMLHALLDRLWPDWISKLASAFPTPSISFCLIKKAGPQGPASLSFATALLLQPVLELNDAAIVQRNLVDVRGIRHQPFRVDVEDPQ